MVVERFVAWAASACVEERTEAIRDIALNYVKADTDEIDRKASEKIFSFFLDDPSVRVRAAMAEVLSGYECTPKGLIWNLSHDIPEVSSVVYRTAPQLCSRTLQEGVEGGTAAIQQAIAQRDDLDGDVVRRLVAMADATAVLHLLENTSVVLGPVLKHDIASRVGDDPGVRAHLLRDDGLKPETRQMLVMRLSHSLFNLVENKAWSESARIRQAANDSANRVTVDIAMRTSVEAMEDYVDHLCETDQLTPALLLRSICAGNAAFFETAIARLSGASMKRVQSIVDEARLSAFRSLYARTGLPKAAYGVFAAAIDVWQHVGASVFDEDFSEALLNEQAITEILARVENDPSVDGSLLAMLRRLAAEAARGSARGYREQLLLAAA